MTDRLSANTVEALIQCTLDLNTGLKNTVADLHTALVEAEQRNAKLIEEREAYNKEAETVATAQDTIRQATINKYHFSETILMQIKMALEKIHVESIGEKYMLPCHDVMLLIDKALLDVRARRVDKTSS